MPDLSLNEVEMSVLSLEDQQEVTRVVADIVVAQKAKDVEAQKALVVERSVFLNRAHAEMEKRGLMDKDDVAPGHVNHNGVFGGGQAPASMPGPEVVESAPMPDTFGDDFERVKAAREAVSDLKKKINDLSRLMRPAWETFVKAKAEPIPPEAMEGLVARVEALEESRAAVAGDAEIEMLITKCAEDATNLTNMGQDQFDTAMEDMRRRQQVCFKRMKAQLGEMKAHKKAFLAANN